MYFSFNSSNVTINVSPKEFEKFSDVLVAGEAIESVNTFTLTDEELYALKCILHHVVWNKGSSSLLSKFVLDEDNFTEDDYAKVNFKLDAFDDVVIEFVEGNE